MTDAALGEWTAEAALPSVGQLCFAAKYAVAAYRNIKVPAAAEDEYPINADLERRSGTMTLIVN